MEDQFKREKKTDGEQRGNKRKLRNPDQPTVTNFFSKVPRMVMPTGERLQVKFIVGGIHPYSTVEEDSYKALILGNNTLFHLLTRSKHNQSV